MGAEYTIDVDLDVGGDSNAAEVRLEKRGFSYISVIPTTEISLDQAISFLEKNHIPYACAKNYKNHTGDENTIGIFLKGEDDHDRYRLWAAKIWDNTHLHSQLINTQTLLNTHLLKKDYEKIKKVYLKSSVEISSVARGGIRYGGYYARQEDVTKLVKAIKISFKSNGGIDLTSIKDFKKLIDIREDKEALTIKFYDDAQAAEFILIYGDTFPKQ